VCCEMGTSLKAGPGDGYAGFWSSPKDDSVRGTETKSRSARL
jgi:hypothetical protein